MKALGKLFEQLNIEAVQIDLYYQALTHRSASKQNNERLEFLGDSILNFTIAAELFSRYPDYSEGDLSRLRSSLVDGVSLAKLAKGLSLGEYLQLGGGELKSGGARRESILADAMEAIFGAVFIDHGMETAQTLIKSLYQNQLNNLPSIDELKDGKTRLQEWLQGRGYSLPTYSLVDASGKPHEQVFTVECKLDGHNIVVTAQGRNRRKAEQEAALLALNELKNEA